jgi:hypothetical protein
MHALSNARGQKFIVGFIKAEDRYFKDSSYSNETLFKALSEASDAIADVTLAPRYEDLDRSLSIHPLNKHPSALANSLRAQRIVPVIETGLRQWLPGDRAGRPDAKGRDSGRALAGPGPAGELVPVEGIEPPTSRLRSDCSTS